MKTLLILRHGKAEKGSHLPDHDRPLTDRGERQSVAAGERLRQEGLVPDAILTSTADRAKRTAELAAEACGFQGEIEIRDELYLAESKRLLDVVRGLPAKNRVAMIVGHNPGLENLVSELTGVHHTLGTGCLVAFELEIPSWLHAGAGTHPDKVFFWDSDD